MRGQRWFAIGVLVIGLRHEFRLSDVRPAQAGRHDGARPGQPGRQ